MKSKSLCAEVFFFIVCFGIILVPVLNAGVVSIPGCAARPGDNTTASYGYNADASGFSIASWDPVSSFDVYFPVYLPNAVTVKKYLVILSDDVPSGSKFADFTVYLERINLLTGQEDYMAGLNTYISQEPGQTYVRTPFWTTKIKYNKVNNNLYSYVIHISYTWPDPGRIFHGAQIFY